MDRVEVKRDLAVAITIARAFRHEIADENSILLLQSLKRLDQQLELNLITDEDENNEIRIIKA